MKYDFIETFTDIDDKLIANAKPVAQKPTELSPEPRSKSLVWKRCAAAAACLAVLAAAGGVIAVKASNYGQIASPGSGDALLSNDSTGGQINSTVNEGMKTIGLDQFYGSIQGISRYLSHNDSEIYDNDDEKVRFKIVNSAENNGVRLFAGLECDEFGLNDKVAVVAALENTSDSTIYVAVPYSKDETEPYYNIIGTHSEIAVEIKNGSVELNDASVQEEFFIDDPHILAIEPGETYYQAMSFDTYYRESSKPGAERIDVPSGTYNGTASVTIVSDLGEISVHSLDFDVNIAEWSACTNYFVNNGNTEKLDHHFFDGMPFVYKKDGIYLKDDETLTKLYGGEYVKDFYMYDLDHNVDIISTVTVNSSFGDVVYAYDRDNGFLFVLDEHDKYNNNLFVLNGRLMVRKTDMSGAEISVEPLRIDMFSPCVIRKNGEPAVVTIDPDSVTSGEVPMAPIADRTGI